MRQTLPTCALSPAAGRGIPKIGYAKSIMDYISRWLELKFLTGDQGELFKALSGACSAQLTDPKWHGSGWSARRTYPDGRCARLQHLRFADGTERNLLPLHDLWEYKRVLVAGMATEI